MLLLAFGISLSLAGSDEVLSARDTARALTVPPWWEANATASGETFASRLRGWQWHSVALRYRGRSQAHGLEAFTVHRYGQWNSGLAFEESLVPRRGAYVAVRVQLAPRATIAARSDASATLYQAIGGGWEFVPSARRMAFADTRVHVWGVGLTRYTGLWYLRGRIDVATMARTRGVAGSAGARRYRADAAADFVDVNVSYGHEVALIGEGTTVLHAAKSAVMRGQLMPWSRVGASLAITYEANASLPDRRGAALSTFVRW